MTAQVIHGDCIDAMRTMPDCSVDAIVTDPPYGLGFMGKAWDALPPGRECAEECLRVLKPGGHLLAFGGTRTWHRLAVAIEDAGFELRDSIAWLYGSGFPKSADVSKMIDKGQGLTEARAREFTAWMRSTGITREQISQATGTATMGGHYLAATSQPAIATADLFDRLRPLLPEVPERIERLVAERTGIAWPDYIKRPVLITRQTTDRRGDGTVVGLGHSGNADVTAPASPEAARWQGWGTALKPAFEPVVVARKPLAGTVAANVLAHGTGALNIDAARGDGGRWPANIVLDEDAAAELERQQAGASRFAYVAKAPTRERPEVDGVTHPTVKPLELMRWLVRLVTPPGGTVLDPFAGSGTTLEAALLEGFDCIGIEREADYLPLIEARITRAQNTNRDLFGGAK